MLAILAILLLASAVRAKLALNPRTSGVFTASAVTWNHAEISPTMRDCEFLKGLLVDDLVLLGVQECEDVRPRRTEGHRSRRWREIRDNVFKKTHDCIIDHKLGGMQLSLYCNKQSEFPIKDFKVIEVPCGVGNVLGNKGAIAAVLKLKKHNSIALINCHLAAHDSKVAQRNADYRRIVHSILAQTPSDWLLKSPPRGKLQSAGSLLSTSASVKWNPALNKYFAGSIFMGDFNYRLEVSKNEVYGLQDAHDQLKKEFSTVNGTQSKVSEEARRLRQEIRYTSGVDVNSPGFKKFRDQLDLIQDLDQLMIEKAKGRILKGFQEGEILFPPTYKYDKRSTRFDTSKKARCPAWTDRILYSVHNATGRLSTETTVSDEASIGNNTIPASSSPLVALNRYSSLDVRSSDHRPVYASFTLRT